eukprot:gene12986-3753_t
MDYANFGQDDLKEILAQKATELFKVCDKDGKGYITQEDLLELTKELALSSDQVQSAFVKLDTDENKFLTLDEFIGGFGVFLGVEHQEDLNPEERKRQEKARELFDLCDEGSKGYVTKTDLLRLMKTLGLTKDQLILIFDQLDDDQNGFLTIHEFTTGFSEYLDDSFDDHEQAEFGRQGSFNQYGADNDPKYCSTDVITFVKQPSVEQLDSNAKLLINNIDECIADSLTKEQLAELWKTLQQTDVRTLTRFEEFLINITSEIKRARQETVHLENTLKRKALSHDIEVQKLYEEMEQQIKTEKTKINDLEARREKMIREEMKIQLEDKDSQLTRLMTTQRERFLHRLFYTIARIDSSYAYGQLEERLFEIQQHEHNLKQENIKLVQQNSELEERLKTSVSSLEDTQVYVSTLQASTAKEKRDRIRAAMQASHGMQKEHESLIRQLDMLREMNQKLRDDKDAIESSMKMRADRTTSLDDEIHMAEGKIPLQKTGSIMSSYFSATKRGRQNSSTSARNRNLLEKQGSLMSLYFEPSRGSQESLVYGDIPPDDMRQDSFNEDDHPEWRRRLIRAVEEDGELMLGDTESMDYNSDTGTLSASFSTENGNKYFEPPGDDHDVLTSTPIRSENPSEESPTRRRRMLPTIHGGNESLYQPRNEDEDVIGHIKALRRKLSNEHVLNGEVDGINRSEGVAQNEDTNDKVDDVKKLELSSSTCGAEEENCGNKYRNDENFNIDDESGSVSHEDMESELGNSHEQVPGQTEDQMSATESEADRMSHGVEEEMKEVISLDMEESKKHLREMLNDLAKPQTQQKALAGSDSNDASSSNAPLNAQPSEEPPSNPNRVYKIVFVGDSGVGKSSLIHRFCFNHFRTNFSATIGVDFQVKIVKVFQEWVALQLWDTAGQERFRSITKQYFRKADGVIVMFDLCSERSFKNMRNWMNSVEDSAEPECTVMILGNKLDLADDGFRKIKVDIGEKLAQDFSSAYFEVSAKSGHGVNEAMVKMSRLLAEKEDSLMKMSVLNLDVNSDSKKKKTCC